MYVIRTLLWVVLTALVVAFVAMNWLFVPVNFWPLENRYLHFEWPVGVVALVFYLLGALPVWLVAKAGRWRLQRRIAALENAARAIAPLPVVPPEPVTEPETPGTLTQ
jgi:uncharacterized integral membrane protein